MTLTQSCDQRILPLIRPLVPFQLLHLHRDLGMFKTLGKLPARAAAAALRSSVLLILVPLLFFVDLEELEGRAEIQRAEAKQSYFGVSPGQRLGETQPRQGATEPLLWDVFWHPGELSGVESVPLFLVSFPPV